VVNADEAKTLFAAVQNLSDPLRVENRSTPPKDAELVTIMLGIIPEGPVES